MKEYNFTEEQLEKMTEEYAFDECVSCKGIREVAFEHIIINVAGKRMEYTALPMLRCTACGELAFTFYARCIIDGCYKELKARNDTGVVCNPSNYRKHFNFCSGTDYIYDHRDYESIPGLMTPMSNTGFLQPVYFKKEALLYFVNSPDYETNIFSETYGELSKIDKTGDFPFEWNIPFGFNTNNLLVFWLGDLDKTDIECQLILKAFNVESDHLLIDSEFYRAQLKVIWSDPIKEHQIINNKKIFTNNVEKKYGIRLNHLDEECEILAKKAVRPVVYTENTLSETLNALHKVLIEGMNSGQLRLLYEQFYSSAERDKKYGEWGTIRLIQEIIDKIDVDPSKDLRRIIAPLYLLNDFRIIFDHLLKNEELEKRKQNIVNTLIVSSFTDYENIYKKEIAELDKLFQYLVIITK